MCHRETFWSLIKILFMFLPSGEPVLVFWLNDTEVDTCAVDRQV